MPAPPANPKLGDCRVISSPPFFVPIPLIRNQSNHAAESGRRGATSSKSTEVGVLHQMRFYASAGSI